MSFITIIDTETTGLEPSTGCLVEIAAARFDLEFGELIDARTALVKRTKGEHGAEEVHGIPSELPEMYGVASVAMLSSYASGSLAVVAHNAEFDRKWLPDLVVPWADSLDFEFPKPSHSRSLAAIALAHGVGVCRAHRALDDVMTLAALLGRCKELGADLERMVQRALRPKIAVQALVSYDDRDKAKDARFQWQPEKKMWTRFMFIEDVAALPFKTKEISP